MRLLIVDDSETMLAYLCGLMRELDHDTCACTNGQEAVEQYGAYHPDLVLMDIRMPGMDGFEATKRITRADPNARVAIVTDYDSDEFRKRAEAVGAARFFLKDDMLPLLSYIANR